MRKYRPGRLVTSLDDLTAQTFVYWNDKITHRGWVRGWQIGMAQSAIRAGIIRTAEKTEVEDGNTDE